MSLIVIVGGPIAMFIYSMASGWQPKESWSEVFFWVSILTGAVFLILHYRRHKLIKILNTGHKVSANIIRCTVASQWVTLRFSYLWQGKMVNSSIWLANSKRSSCLQNKDELTLAIDPLNHKKVVIADLYSE
jgi:MFS family permease